MAVNRERAEYIRDWCREQARSVGLERTQQDWLGVIQIKRWKKLANELILKLIDAGMGTMVGGINSDGWTRREQVVAALSTVADVLEQKFPVTPQHPSPARVDETEPDDSLPERDKRPAYERDHCWLRWADQEGMKPAAIRDRWNALSEDERRSISPCAYEPLGDGSPARSIVHQGLKKARGENDKAQ